MISGIQPGQRLHDRKEDHVNKTLNHAHESSVKVARYRRVSETKGNEGVALEASKTMEQLEKPRCLCESVKSKEDCTIAARTISSKASREEAGLKRER